MASGYILEVLKVEPIWYFSGLEVAWAKRRHENFSRILTSGTGGKGLPSTKIGKAVGRTALGKILDDSFF